MNFRKMITLIEMLALTGVMSVGFSTWVIVETSFPEIHVQVETEKVLNYNKYIKFKNIVFSDYDEYGFYNDFVYSDDHNTSGEGAGRSLSSTISTTVIINLDECRKDNILGNISSLDFELTINYADFGIYKAYIGNNLSFNLLKYSYDEITYNPIDSSSYTFTPDVNSGTGTTKFTIEDGTNLNSKEKLYINVIYLLEFTDYNYYHDNFYLPITGQAEHRKDKKGLSIFYILEMGGL